MVKRSVRVRIQDMLTAMDDAEAFLDGRDFAVYQSSQLVQRAVERCLEIVSEASRHIPAELKQQYPNVPWPEIKAIGNFLRHDYQTVEDHVIWRTVTKSLPELRPVLVEMLAELDEQ